MNILVTGGAGFIGSHMTRFLVEGGHEVSIVDNCITGNLRNISDSKAKITLHEADIVSFDFEQLKPVDIIFHLASPASPVQYQRYPIETLRTNSEGTYRVLEFAKRSPGCRFVMASTSEVYGDPLVHPQPETYWGNVNSYGDRACYDEAKRYAEAISYVYWKKFGVDVRIARIFNTYGPQMEKEDGRVVSNFVNQCIANEPVTVYGDGSQTRSLCYVSDMVKGLFALATTNGITGEVINLGNPHEKTVLEIAQLIKELTKSSSEIVFKPLGEDDPKRRKPETAKAENLLNWKAVVDLETGLRQTIEYFKTLAE